MRVAFSTHSIRNRFDVARNKVLRSQDIDTYIDSAVVGNDRKLAQKLMALMPSGLRGDFIYVAPDGHLVSNNPAMLPYATVTYGQRPVVTTTPAGPARNGIGSSSTVRRTRDYSSPCSPPNPPSRPGGAYARMVSQCGFTAGWGFVTIPQGDNYMAAGDNGTLYFEIQAPNQGTTTEGGFAYYSDTSIAPYARSTAPEYAHTNNGYLTLTNGTQRYRAGQLLAVMHGLTSNGLYMFVVAGQSPPGLDPQRAYITGQQFTVQNAGWLFFDSSPDMGNATGATNNARVFSPCIGCSVSKVVSIAQNGLPPGYGYDVDGSYFGVTSTGADSILWQQVAFGNWDTNCRPGTSLCTFIASSDPTVYYGGTQFYPYQGISDTNPGPSNYGPYTSWDSVDLSGDSGFNVARHPLGGFTEPLPPTCQPDAYGYCVVTSGGAPLQQQNVTCMAGNYPASATMWTGQQWWYVQVPNKVMKYYSYTGVDVNGAAPDCSDQPYWDPAEPSAALGDPNLP